MVARRHELASEVKHKGRKAEPSRYPKACPSCQKKGTVKKFVAVKCVNCGSAIADFGKELKKGWKLKTKYDSKNKEVIILGNAEGLEFLAGACLAVIGKTDPSGHIHLQWQMNNLRAGSVSVNLEFSNDPADYR